MLLESDTLQLHSEGPTATLRLAGASFGEFREALNRVDSNLFIEILVIRGFHLKPPSGTDRYEYARTGRQVLDRLEELPIPTLAMLDESCLGPAWETALACDWRLALATPDTWFGLGDLPCWGGTARMRRLTRSTDRGPFSAREARDLGLVDHAFCERRAKIELRTWLDRLERAPRKRRRSWFGWRRDLALNERELRNYLAAESVGSLELDQAPRNGGRDPNRSTLELRRCPQAVPFAVEFILRGGRVVTDDPEALGERLEEPLLRGRVTPLELEQARDRVLSNGPTRLVFEGESSDPLGIVRAFLAPHSSPIRIGFPILPDSTAVEVTPGSAAAAIASVLEQAGFTAFVVPDSPSLSIRPLLAAYWDEAVRMVAEDIPIDLVDEASRSISIHPPLRTLDRIGLDRAVSLVPRLKPFVDAGQREAFYHVDRPIEANTLARVLLPSAPRILMADDEREEWDDETARREIEARFRNRIGEVTEDVSRATGFRLPSGKPLPATERSIRHAA